VDPVPRIEVNGDYAGHTDLILLLAAATRGATTPQTPLIDNVGVGGIVAVSIRSHSILGTLLMI